MSRFFRSPTITRLGVAVVAALVLTAAVKPSEAPGPSSTRGNVNAARVLADVPLGENWLLNGREFGSSHYSPLRQINDGNIQRMGLAWSLDVDSPMGMATEPIVVDGTIYVPGTLNRVFAIDAVSGKTIWTFDPHIQLRNTMMGSYAARITRGVAVWEGKVFIGTGDCRVVAVDAATGRQRWGTTVCDATQTGITGAPRVGGGKVYIGYFGSDTGTRGSVIALDANSGKISWRFWNVPGNPSEGFDNKALEMAASTWSGENWWEAGGGAAWDPIVYDQSTGLLIYGTAGPSRGLDNAIKTSGDRLFSNCIVALRADTGEYVWHYQTSKHAPGHPSPENFHIIVTDMMIDGANRRVALTVPRFGGFFMLDAKTGTLISWKSMADRPEDQLSPPTESGAPRNVTNRNWWPMSFNPQTGLTYVPLYEQSADTGHGQLADEVGRLVAWDPLRQTSRWSVYQSKAINGGVLSTGGNLVVQGEGTGELVVYAADSGRRLWSLATGSAIQGIPVTYQVNGRQYLLVPVGLGGGMRMFSRTSMMATLESKRGPSRLLAFALDATTPFPFPKVVIPPVPKPPVQTASKEVIEMGRQVLVNNECFGCHGGVTLDGSGEWSLNGAVPDLRYMPREIHDQFFAIVLGGMRREYGMPGFADGHVNWPHSHQMTLDEAKVLYAYIVDIQWKAYNTDQVRLRSRKQH